MTDPGTRREAALEEILDVTKLLRDACRSGAKPAALLARIESAVARLDALKREAAEDDAPAIRAPGAIEFPDPLVAYEPSPRTLRLRRRLQK